MVRFVTNGENKSLLTTAYPRRLAYTLRSRNVAIRSGFHHFLARPFRHARLGQAIAGHAISLRSIIDHDAVQIPIGAVITVENATSYVRPSSLKSASFPSPLRPQLEDLVVQRVGIGRTQRPVREALLREKTHSSVSQPASLSAVPCHVGRCPCCGCMMESRKRDGHGHDKVSRLTQRVMVSPEQLSVTASAVQLYAQPETGSSYCSMFVVPNWQ